MNPARHLGLVGSITSFLGYNSAYKNAFRSVWEHKVWFHTRKTTSSYVSRSMIHQRPRQTPSSVLELRCPSTLHITQLIHGPVCTRWLSTENSSKLDDLTYERVVNEALEDLTEHFESLDELENCPEEYDVRYADGVLTVSLSPVHGTYVINKQTPNKQIWLSSPKSGPKRYDFSASRWIYSHDDRHLHMLLSEEISEIFQEMVDFSQLVRGP